MNYIPIMILRDGQKEKKTQMNLWLKQKLKNVNEPSQQCKLKFAFKKNFR